MEKREIDRLRFFVSLKEQMKNVDVTLSDIVSILSDDATETTTAGTQIVKHPASEQIVRPVNVKPVTMMTKGKLYNILFDWFHEATSTKALNLSDREIEMVLVLLLENYSAELPHTQKFKKMAENATGKEITTQSVYDLYRKYRTKRKIRVGRGAIRGYNPTQVIKPVTASNKPTRRQYGSPELKGRKDYNEITAELERQIDAGYGTKDIIVSIRNTYDITLDKQLLNNIRYRKSVNKPKNKDKDKDKKLVKKGVKISLYQGRTGRDVKVNEILKGI